MVIGVIDGRVMVLVPCACTVWRCVILYRDGLGGVPSR
jgi:hypothetical protein